MAPVPDQTHIWLALLDRQLLMADPDSNLGLTLEVVSECWARCLGDCSNRLSREHPFPNPYFRAAASASKDLRWCKGKAVDIGISGLAAKILCIKHNNAFSPIDSAGAEAFATLREMSRLTNLRKGMKPRPWKIVRYRINGPALELWFLKTLINLCCDRDLPIGRDATEPGRPSERLVRIAFGHESLQRRAGLYWVVRTGMRIDSTDTVSFSPLIKLRRHVEGGLFTFRGLNILLFLEPEGPPVPFGGIKIGDEDLGAAQLNFHNKQITVTAGRFRSQVLEIEW